MANDILDTLNKLSEATIENYKKISAANLKLTEKLLQEQADLVESLIGATKTTAEKAAKTKDVQAIASNQVELAQECLQLVLDSGKSCGDVLGEAGKNYNQILEAGMDAANANFGGAKPKTTAGSTKTA